MPVPSVFKRKSSDKKPKPKPTAEEIFSGDDSLLQLHAETAELLRLVKTPASIPKSKSASSASKQRQQQQPSAGSPMKRAVRETIEVLEDDDDDDADECGGGGKATSTTGSSPTAARRRPPSAAGYGGEDLVDPFAFHSEETRVRKAADTFLPDTSPSKQDIGRQQSHLSSEHARLQAIDHRETVQVARHAYEAEHRPVINRVEDSAIKIQAHSRGFLSRKHAEEDRKKQEQAQEQERIKQEASHWHEVRDVDRNEVWFYNALSGESEWERPACLPPLATSQSLPELPTLASHAVSSASASASVAVLPGLPRVTRDASLSTDLPPLSPSTSRPNSSNSSTTRASSRPPSSSSTAKVSRLLPSLAGNSNTATPSFAFDYAAATSPSPWECDSVAGSSAASDQASLCSERLEDEDDDGGGGHYRGAPDFSRGRPAVTGSGTDPGLDDAAATHRQRPPRHDTANDDDWQANDSLFLADGSKNSKLRDTIRNALQTSKFDSVSSLIASNVILRKKPHKGRRTSQQDAEAHSGSNQHRQAGREIVLGRRDAPMFVALLDKTSGSTATNSNSHSPSRSSTTKASSKRRAQAALPIGTDPSNPFASSPQIRDLADPGLYEEEPKAHPRSPQAKAHHGSPASPQKPGTAAPPPSQAHICFNCWSSSTGRHCDLHLDPNDSRKVKSAESALMCANWQLNQLRKKYRAEEIQEIFMKQNASLRYDPKIKQYITVIEARHPIYRLMETLVVSWSKTMRRKLHTRAWFRSFIEQLRAGGVPKADSATPALMKLKTTIQNNRWCAKYSDSVREFHPKPPVTLKTHKNESFSLKNPIYDVIMVNPAKPQLQNWILKTECTIPVELYKPRKYECPPKRCVPMPTPSFVDEIPLPVANVFIDSGHLASWFERQSARVCGAALQKALLQIQACSPPRGVTDARRTKQVTPVTVLFATFARKPTKGMLAVGGLSAELLIHLLVTTYIPAQYGHFIVFERRTIAPQLTKDYDAPFGCLEIDPTTLNYVFRPLEHALNGRRPPCLVISTRLSVEETEEQARKRFPGNRPEQTGEEESHGFRTFWLIDAFHVNDHVNCATVEPTLDILSPNTTSMNTTLTTKVDRFYPFCIPTTKANTPIEFIHLLWIGQSSRNQTQTFTTLGAQQPGEFMKNSNPNGALGVCTSVIYRSWAYMQSSPFEEFTTEEGIAYWYDKQNGETFWSRPLLPVECHRGKDGDVDGVVAHGHGEVATLGVGVDSATYPQQELRKYMTTKMEPPEAKAKRLKQVAVSARKHELVVTLNEERKGEYKQQQVAGGGSAKGALTKVQVPALALQKKQGGKQQAAAGLAVTSPVKSAVPSRSPQKQQEPLVGVDPTTQQLINTITQALGSNGAAGADMLQLGIGLGMGLGLRNAQQQQQQLRAGSSSRSSIRSRPRTADSQVSFAGEMDHGQDDDYEDDEDQSVLSTNRSDTSSTGRSGDGSYTGRSVLSTATSVDVGLSPDELELLPEAERARVRAAYEGKKTPGYQTHPPPGEGRTWVDKPIDGSQESQTAVDGFNGSLHQRVACLPKDFVTAVSTTKTCKMQANYLPIIKNTNEPRSVGIVRPRAALDEWQSAGYSPWSAGRSIFGTQFIKNLMHRPEILAAQKSGNNSSSNTTVGSSGGGPGATASSAVVQVEKKENVTQAVKEAQQLETVFSLCRHGKYDELERMITSPDWTLSLDAKDVTGNTLLSIACQNNNKRIAKLCLRRGADLNTQNLNGQTLLHYCHEYGFHDLMDYLLDKGARDDILNADGLTCYEGLSKEAVDAI